MSVQHPKTPESVPDSIFTRPTKACLLAVLAASSAMLCMPASARQSQTDEVEEIVVISSRIPIPLRQLATSVSVLDEFDIESRGNLQLSDVLRQMPAVGSSNNGGIGKNTTIRIRGEEGFRTLTYIDGMRLQDPSSPQIATDFSQLLTDGIDRIEILRGPQGLAYGADAGGVINIGTRSVVDGFFVSLDGQTGRFGTNQLSGNISGRSGNFDYFLSLTDFDTDGFNTRDNDNVSPDDDGYSNTGLHGRLGFDLTDEWRVDVVHRNVDGANEYDSCFDSATSSSVHQCSNDYELSATRIGVEYDGESFSHNLSYTTTQSERQNYTLDIPSFDALGEQYRLEYIGSATSLPGFDLVFGGDMQEDIGNGRDRDNTGVFLEYLSDFSESLFFTAGVRHDDNEDFGTNTSYRISAAYLFELDTGTLKVKSALGTGFRAPSPFEVVYNRRPAAFPPASEVTLMQEESSGWEAGIEYFSGDLRLEAVYFDQDVENAIFFDRSSFSGYLQDVGISTSQGAELTAEIPVTDSFRVTGNFTYNETYRPDGRQRLRRPQRLLNLGLNYAGLDGRLHVNGFYRHQADSIDSLGPLDNFGVFDLTASFEISSNVRLYGRLENAFDEKYEEVISYNTAERAAYVGVNVSFNGL